MFQKKAGMRWTWKSPNGVTKTEIDYTLTNIIGSDHRLAMSNIKLEVEVERKTLMTKRPPTVDAPRIGSKKIEFQLELRNRFETLQELDDIDTMSETVTYIIQQNALRVAKTINMPHQSRISSPTRALMTKRREMAENGDNKQRIEYAEICKTIKKKAREDIRKNNHEIIRETVMASKSLKKVRRTQMLCQDRLITFLDKQDREIHDEDKIIGRIEEFYTDLYDSEHNTIIHTYFKEVPEITSWEVEAALRDMKNGTATGNDRINIETLKAGEDTISNTLAKLYIKCLSERRIPTAWKKAKMMIIFKKGNKKDLKNYRPICLQSNIYTVHMYSRKY